MVGKRKKKQGHGRERVQGGKAGEVKAWLERCESSKISELVSFAAGIAREEAVILAALEQPFSNGLTEGHVNRVKMIKRVLAA